jgi:hypothetical protein
MGDGGSGASSGGLGPMGSMNTGRPKLLQERETDSPLEHEVVALDPVPLRGLAISEKRLQDLLEDHPDLLPIEEISSSWGPLVSLGTEIPLTAGYVDNLFVSPAGELTLVEAKLWRNPEARREVIGQILDYAAALAMMSYEDLDAAVAEASPGRRSTWDAGRGGPSMWELLSASKHAPDPHTEAAFIDTVTRNPRLGRFLLLVVGDGIRTDLQGLADLLGGHPALRFHLELVEMKFHSIPGSDDWLVVPSIVGRTDEVVRAVVDIKNPGGAAVSVSVEVTPPDPPPSRVKLASLDEFTARAAETIGSERAEAIADLAQWWQDTLGGIIKYNTTSVALWARRTGTAGVSVLILYTDGTATGSVASIANTHNLAAPDDALARFEAAGFPDIPNGPASPWIRPSKTNACACPVC